jgi:hypothetical protein
MAKNVTDRKLKNEASAKKRRAAKSNQGGQGDRSNYQKRIREKKLAEGSRSRKGCFPKLLMLVLPILAAGAILFLRS